MECLQLALTFYQLVQCAVVTAIELQQVHAPVGKGLGIKVIVAITAREASAGFVSNIPINPQLQPFGMDLRGADRHIMKTNSHWAERNSAAH